jgi:hypothetical protein
LQYTPRLSQKPQQVAHHFYALKPSSRLNQQPVTLGFFPHFPENKRDCMKGYYKKESSSSLRGNIFRQDYSSLIQLMITNRPLSSSTTIFFFQRGHSERHFISVG